MLRIVRGLAVLAAEGGIVFIHVFPPSVERSIILELTTRHLLSGFEGETDSVKAISLLSKKPCPAANAPGRESAATPGEAAVGGGAEEGAGGASGATAGAFIAFGSARSRRASSRSCKSALG